MFGKEFYPTPPKLIRRMLDPYFKNEHLNLSDIEILEPSAGKGDICDFIKDKLSRYNSRVNISCIEVNEDLKAILKEKGYPVIANDFLQYNESMFWDLIIMNPPFSNGDEHLLHAIYQARNTDIICILNAETIRNPYTKTRQLLENYIKEFGEVEYIENAFDTAEHKTSVEVALVRLKMTDVDNTFDYGFEKEKMPDLDFNFDVESNAIARKDLIGNMQVQNKIVLKYYLEKLKADSRYNYFFSNMCNAKDSYGYRTEAFHMDGGNDKQRYNFLSKSLKRFMWQQVIQELDVEKYMSAKVKKNFEAYITQQIEVAFTKENVALFFQFVMNNRVNIWEEAIVDVFDVLTRYTKDNRLHVEGWKTNDKYKINRRIILPNWVLWKESYDDNQYMKDHGRKFSLCYHRNKEYTDIDKVLAYISGHALPHWCTIDTNLENYFHKLGVVRIGESFDNTTSSGYFDIKFFKKGTVHLYFKKKELWDEFNMRACAGKDWLPGPEKHQWEEELKRRRKERNAENETQKEELLTLTENVQDLVYNDKLL